MKPYNGHRSWNAWNVALWIGNDEGLYNLAMDCIRRARLDRHGRERSKARQLRMAAFYFRRYFDVPRTPDGATGRQKGQDQMSYQTSRKLTLAHTLLQTDLDLANKALEEMQQCMRWTERHSIPANNVTSVHREMQLFGDWRSLFDRALDWIEDDKGEILLLQKQLGEEARK